MKQLNTTNEAIIHNKCYATINNKWGKEYTKLNKKHNKTGNKKDKWNNKINEATKHKWF